MDALTSDPSRQEQAKQLRGKIPPKDLPKSDSEQNIKDRDEVLSLRAQDITALEEAPRKPSSDQLLDKGKEPATSTSDPTPGTETALPALATKSEEPKAPLTEDQRENMVGQIMWRLTRLHDQAPAEVVAILEQEDYSRQTLRDPKLIPDDELQDILQTVIKEQREHAPEPDAQQLTQLLDMVEVCGADGRIPDSILHLTLKSAKKLTPVKIKEYIDKVSPIAREHRKQKAAERSPAGPIGPQPSKGNGMAENKPSGQPANPADRPRKFAPAGQSGAGGGLPPPAPVAEDPVQAAGSAPRRQPQTTGEPPPAEKEVAKRLKNFEDKCKKSKKLNWWLGIGLAAAVVAFVVLFIVANNAIDRAKAKQKASTSTTTAVPTKTEAGTPTSKFRVVPRLPAK
ncbi:MAG: hypothetical protein WD972_03410 [Candidatus Andersenbacteria bacterium]